MARVMLDLPLELLPLAHVDAQVELRRSSSIYDVMRSDIHWHFPAISADMSRRTVRIRVRRTGLSQNVCHGAFFNDVGEPESEKLLANKPMFLACGLIHSQEFESLSIENPKRMRIGIECKLVLLSRLSGRTRVFLKNYEDHPH